MLTQEDNGEIVEKADAEKREVDKMQDGTATEKSGERELWWGKWGAPVEMGPPEGFACFVDICLQQGAEAFLFLCKFRHFYNASLNRTLLDLFIFIVCSSHFRLLFE